MHEFALASGRPPRADDRASYKEIVKTGLFLPNSAADRTPAPRLRRCVVRRRVG
jgi:hypothetical protein